MTVGDCGVGKTSLILRMANVDAQLQPTVGMDFFTHDVTVKEDRKAPQTVTVRVMLLPSIR